MKAQLTCALLLSLACFPALAAAQEMLDPPSFTEAVEVNVVNVDVRVTDSNGRPITGLRKRDFELFEDGKRVDISNFAAVVGGVSREDRDETPPAGAATSAAEDTAVAAAPEDAWNLIVYVDNFNLHPGNRARALQQLRDFLGRELRPRDRVMVVSYEQGFTVRLPFSSDPAAVSAALAEVEKLATGGASIDLQRQQAFRQVMSIQEASVADFKDPLPCPLEIARPAHDFAQVRRDEVMRNLGSLTVLVNSLSGVPGRKAVLYVSDGIPAVPGEEVFQFLAELCGGGGSSGLGRSTPGNTYETESNQQEDAEGKPIGKPEVRDPSLDPLAVYDASALGPRSYKAVSQAPLDAQGYSLVKQLGALVAHANSQRVTLYTLQASGAEAPSASNAAAGATDRLFQFASIATAQRASLQNSLHAMADGTGGRAMLDVNDFKPELARMREDFESYYSLGFTPNHKAAGAGHRLEVRVKRKGAQLRYRESYRDKTPIERAVDRTLAALLYDIEENPLKIEVELGEQSPGPSGTVAVPVRLRIPLAKVAVLRGDGVYEGNLRVLVATRAADGRGSAVKQVPVPIRIPKDDVLHALGQFYVYTLTLNLVPGDQKIAVGVRDDTSANTSYLSRAVKVMPLDTAAAAVSP